MVISVTCIRPCNYPNKSLGLEIVSSSLSLVLIYVFPLGFMNVRAKYLYLDFIKKIRNKIWILLILKINIVFFFKIKEKHIAHASTQTEIEHLNEDETAKNNKETDSEPKSVADEIKEAAEQAMQNMGFVYEATSGMYYDYNTGYYYNAVSRNNL